jgi:prephenate dehydratase
MGAAEEVKNGDGTLASIGTPEAAKEYGLEELYKEIDGGSVGCYWATSRRPIFNENPTRLVVVARLPGNGQLADLVVAMTKAGFKLLTTYSQAAGDTLFEYDYILRFGGQGSLATVQKELAAFSTARLVGAFEGRDERL